MAAANATAASAGGIALDLVGFPAIGALVLVAAAGSAVLVMRLVREVVGRAGAAASGTGPAVPTI